MGQFGRFPTNDFWIRQVIGSFSLMQFSFIAKEGLVTPKQDVQENTDSDKNIPGLDVTKENGICKIKFNRAQKLNALTHEVTIFNKF